MTKITKYVPGTFCWESLYTSDAATAKTFYQGLFEWKVDYVRTGDAPTYSLFSIQGKEVCGMSELNDKQKKQQIKPHWGTYVSVANVDEFLKVADVAGGRVLEPASDSMDAGRSALIQDPTGATISIWEPHKKIGALITDLPGTACWRELETPNVDVAGKFYATIFNWEPKPEKFGEMAYITFKLGKKSVGGMMSTPKEGMPSNWLTYWTVKDCEKSLNKADKLGGKILKSITEIKRVGKFAVLADPQGAVFAILQPEKK